MDREKYASAIEETANLAAADGNETISVMLQVIATDIRACREDLLMQALGHYVASAIAEGVAVDPGESRH